MSGGAPHDVSLRVRMRYEAGDTARRATGDIEGLAAKARQLGAVSAGDKLVRDLRATSGQAQATGRDLAQVTATAARLGAGDGAARLTGELRAAGQAGGSAKGELAALGQVAARFGAVSTVAYLGRDLRAAQAPAQALRRDLAEIGKAAEGVGRGRALADLAGDLQGASRQADDLERQLASVARHTTGRAGRGERGEFANEALRASGLGMAGLRFGMSGAAAGGLAVGAGVAAVGGSLALATKQAIDFQHAMTEVGKAVGETPAGMRDLESQVLSLSRKSGIAQTEIAGIVAQGGYFNIPREQLARFASIGTRAAVGFQMRPDEAAQALGPLMKSYGLKDVDEVGLAADAVNTIGDGQGVRERNILNFLERVAPTASTLHLPIHKAAAYGGVVESLGVAPDVAATGYNAIMGKLSTANNPEDKHLQRGLRGIHLSGRQVKAMVDQDPEKALDMVLERVRDLPASKKANVIKDLAGEEHAPALARMAAGLDQIRTALDKVSDPAKYRGSLERTFAIFGADTRASINRASTALDSFATRLGQRFDPAVKASADVMARWLGGMAKAMELEDRARKLSGKQLRGEALTEKENAELAANPKLKADTERRVGIGREDAERRAIVEQEGRDRARSTPRPERHPAEPSGPRQPDAEDGAAAEARERTRLRLQGQIRDLDAQVEGRRSGGYETTADRLRLRKLRQQYERQFPEGEGKPDALPGTGKRSDLQGGVKASLASYHDEVEQGLTRTERLAREMGRRIAEDLTVRPKVEDAAFRFGGDGGARVQTAALGGDGLGRGYGGSVAVGGSRGMPGRFGGSIPLPRGGGGGRGMEGGPAGDGRRRGSSSEPAEEGPTENIPGTLNPRLAGSRKALMDELDGDPALRRDVIKTASMENRGSPAKMQAVLESMVNRSKMNGYSSLRQAVHSGFYGPVNRGGLAGALSEKDRRDGEAALKQVREGSNAIGYRTDQGMLTDPGARRYMREPDHSGHRVIGGENFFYMGQKGREWARQQEAADAGQPNRAAAGGRRPEVLADPNDERRRVDEGPRQLRPWKAVPQAGAHLAPTREPMAEVQGPRHPDEITRVTPGYVEGRDAKPKRWVQDPDTQRWRPDYLSDGSDGAPPAGGTDQLRERARQEGLQRRQEPEPRSARYGDPGSRQLKPGAGGDPAAAGGGGRSGASAPNVIQNFHGGFDAHEVGRRAQLEQNREVRRTMAGALHDVGHPVTV